MTFFRVLSAIAAIELLLVGVAIGQVAAPTGPPAPRVCTVAAVIAQDCDAELNGIRIVVNDAATEAECGNLGDSGEGAFENMCRWSDLAGSWVPDAGGVGGGAGQTNTHSSEAGGLDLTAATPKVGVDLRLVALDANDFDSAADLITIDDTKWAKDSELHAESHAVVSHSDTTATGDELETLTDTSNADGLHNHSDLLAAAAPDIRAISTVDCASGFFTDLDGDGLFDNDSTSAPESCINSDEFYYAKDYATGSETGGIQEAIDAAVGLAGVKCGTVIAPRGTTSIDLDSLDPDPGIVIPTCIHLRGYGSHVQNFGRAGTVILLERTTATAPVGILIAGDQVTLSEMLIQWPGSSPPDAGSVAVKCENSAELEPVLSGWFLNNVFIAGPATGTGTGLELNACLRGGIQQTTIKNWDRGIRVKNRTTSKKSNANTFVDLAVTNNTIGIEYVSSDVDSKVCSSSSITGGDIEQNDVGIQFSDSCDLAAYGVHFENLNASGSGANVLVANDANGMAFISIGNRYGGSVPVGRDIVRTEAFSTDWVDSSLGDLFYQGVNYSGANSAINISQRAYVKSGATFTGATLLGGVHPVDLAADVSGELPGDEVAVATDTVRGTATIATDGECAAQTNDTDFVTPACSKQLGHLPLTGGELKQPGDLALGGRVHRTAAPATITTFANGGGGTVLVASAAHGLVDGDEIVIRGATNYSGPETVIAVDADSFKITETWTDDQVPHTGRWSKILELSSGLGAPDVSGGSWFVTTTALTDNTYDDFAWGCDDFFDQMSADPTPPQDECAVGAPCSDNLCDSDGVTSAEPTEPAHEINIRVLAKTSFRCDGSLKCGAASFDLYGGDWVQFTSVQSLGGGSPAQSISWEMTGLKKQDQYYDGNYLLDLDPRTFGTAYLNDISLRGNFDQGRIESFGEADSKPTVVQGVLFNTWRCDDNFNAYCVDIYSSRLGGPCGESDLHCSGVPDGFCDDDGNGVPVTPATQRALAKGKITGFVDTDIVDETFVYDGDHGIPDGDNVTIENSTDYDGDFTADECVDIFTLPACPGTCDTEQTSGSGSDGLCDFNNTWSRTSGFVIAVDFTDANAADDPNWIWLDGDTLCDADGTSDYPDTDTTPVTITDFRGGVGEQVIKVVTKSDEGCIDLWNVLGGGCGPDAQCEGIPDGKCDDDGTTLLHHVTYDCTTVCANSYSILCDDDYDASCDDDFDRSCVDEFNTPGAPGPQTGCTPGSWPCPDDLCDSDGATDSTTTPHTVGYGDGFCDSDGTSDPDDAPHTVGDSDAYCDTDGTSVAAITQDSGGADALCDDDAERLVADTPALICGSSDIATLENYPTAWDRDSATGRWLLTSLETFSDAVKAGLRSPNVFAAPNTFLDKVTTDADRDLGELQVMAASTTPSIAAGSIWETNLPDTWITNFTGGTVGTPITVISGDDNTIFDCGPVLRCGDDGQRLITDEGDLTDWILLGSGEWKLRSYVDVSSDLNTSDLITFETLDANGDIGFGADQVPQGSLTAALTDLHDESHTVVSHSDTTGTGPELDELTDGSTTTLHDHAGGAGETNTHSSEAGGLDLTAATPKVGVDLRLVALDANDFDSAADLVAIDDTKWAKDSELHTESHTVVSHSDTTGTGPELDDLTDGSDADALHDHPKLEAEPTQALILEPDPATDEFVLWLPPVTGTMTRVDCKAYGGTSVTIDLCDGADIGDDTCTTSILGSPLVCTTSGANDTSLSAAGFVARDEVSLVLTAESGTVDQLTVYITSTVD